MGNCVAKGSEVPYSQLTDTVNAMVAEIAEKNTELERLRRIQLENSNLSQKSDNETEMVQLRAQVQTLVDANDNLDQQLQRKDNYISRLEDGIRAVKNSDEHGITDSNVEDIAQIQLQIHSLVQDIHNRKQKIVSLEHKIIELQQQCSAKDAIIDMLKSEQDIGDEHYVEDKSVDRKTLKRSSTFS